VVDPDWDRSLHAMLDTPWPCKEAAEFWTLWPKVIEALTAQGMEIGPATFGVSNDGEPELVRAVWWFGMGAVVDEQVDLAEFRKQPGQVPPA
jgi:hypothetical protein